PPPPPPSPPPPPPGGGGWGPAPLRQLPPYGLRRSWRRSSCPKLVIKAARPGSTSSRMHYSSNGHQIMQCGGGCPKNHQDIRRMIWYR
ncbi:MAG: hypothetical protein F4Y87_00845, partial [Synechococcus sp. SB0665_bin_28]|nr:hypothetical protein [Synechococcus sp. SB0665_bin_28]